MIALFLRYAFDARRFARFIAAGMLNTAFGYAFYALGVTVGLQPSVAVIVSTAAGIVFNYKTIGAVFSSFGKGRFLYFVGAYAVLTPLNIGLLNLGLRFGLDVYASELVALALVTPLSYVVMRRLVFAPRTTRRPAA